MLLTRLDVGPEDRGKPICGFMQNTMAALRAKAAAEALVPLQEKSLQIWLDGQWHGFVREHGGPWFLAEGCRVVRLQVKLFQETVLVRWLTAFHPQARYDASPGEILPLGRHDGYDLSLTYITPLFPALVASWGPGRHAAWELYVPYRRPPQEHLPALREAMKRAHRANALWGTAWSGQDGYPRLALPTTSFSTAGCENAGSVMTPAPPCRTRASRVILFGFR